MDEIVLNGWVYIYFLIYTYIYGCVLYVLVLSPLIQGPEVSRSGGLSFSVSHSYSHTNEWNGGFVEEYVRREIVIYV